MEPSQLELSCATDGDGNQIISVTGELDIATAEQAYAYISDVIDGRPAPVSVDLSGLTFCDASGLGALARIARHARQAGRQLKLTAARPSLLQDHADHRAGPGLPRADPTLSVLADRITTRQITVRDHRGCCLPALNLECFRR